MNIDKQLLVNNQRYELAGWISHTGSPNSGHYHTVVVDDFANYTTLNDNKYPSASSQIKANEQSSVYIVCYIKSDYATKDQKTDAKMPTEENEIKVTEPNEQIEDAKDKMEVMAEKITILEKEKTKLEIKCRNQQQQIDQQNKKIETARARASETEQLLSQRIGSLEKIINEMHTKEIVTKHKKHEERIETLEELTKELVKCHSIEINKTEMTENKLPEITSSKLTPAKRQTKSKQSAINKPPEVNGAPLEEPSKTDHTNAKETSSNDGERNLSDEENSTDFQLEEMGSCKGTLTESTPLSTNTFRKQNRFNNTETTPINLENAVEISLLTQEEKEDAFTESEKQESDPTCPQTLPYKEKKLLFENLSKMKSMSRSTKNVQKQPKPREGTNTDESDSILDTEELITSLSLESNTTPPDQEKLRASIQETKINTPSILTDDDQAHKKKQEIALQEQQVPSMDINDSDKFLDALIEDGKFSSQTGKIPLTTKIVDPKPLAAISDGEASSAMEDTDGEWDSNTQDDTDDSSWKPKKEETKIKKRRSGLRKRATFNKIKDKKKQGKTIAQDNQRTEKPPTQKTCQPNNQNKKKTVTLDTDESNKEETDDNQICVQTKITEKTNVKNYSSSYHTCSHCPGKKLYLDENGNIVQGKVTNKRYEFPKHVLQFHPECKWAKPCSTNKVWLDHDGATWWKSQNEMEENKGNEYREKARAEYKYANRITEPGVSHLELTVDDTIKTAKIFKCSCGTIMKSNFRRRAMVQMKEHVRQKHNLNGTTCYVLMHKNSATDESIEGERQLIWAWNGKWRQLDSEEQPPPPKTGILDTNEGEAPVAREIRLSKKDKIHEHACSLCGRIVLSGNAKHNDHKYQFRTHVQKCHPFPVILEFHDRSRQLALPVDGQYIPDYIDLANSEEQPNETQLKSTVELSAESQEEQLVEPHNVSQAKLLEEPSSNLRNESTMSPANDPQEQPPISQPNDTQMKLFNELQTEPSIEDKENESQAETPIEKTKESQAEKPIESQPPTDQQTEPSIEDKENESQAETPIEQSKESQAEKPIESQPPTAADPPTISQSQISET